jgi:peptidoglycan/xylan/chitin deacetylase (PgdA/CDA1 family)
MLARKLLGGIRWKALESVNRREFSLADSGPIVSFTFDDFPRSALRLGGAILKNYGVSGTFYAAMGLRDQRNDLGEQFGFADLERLLRDGHELGSHTFGHLSCRHSSFRGFEADVWKGKHAVEAIVGADTPHQFSYPYGHVTLRAKPSVGAGMSSCRGTVPGVNESPIDLNLLRANSLYSRSFDLESLQRLLALNKRRRGWLIFYTHDVSESPSPFGCTPGEFESVLSLTLQSRATVLPIGQVVLGAPSCPMVSDASYY